jgi:hypothetical protein
VPIDAWGEVDLAELLCGAWTPSSTPFDGTSHDRVRVVLPRRPGRVARGEGARRGWFGPKPWAEGPLGRPAGAGRRRRCTVVRERGESEGQSLCSLFGSSSQANSIFLSHSSSTSLQPFASQ